MTDIVERLREGGCGDYCDALEHEAADEIERLRAELDLRRKSGSASDRLHNLCEGIAADADGSEWSREEWERIDAENLALRAERDALRADALRYRWLRGDAPAHSTRWPRWEVRYWTGGFWDSPLREQLDAAIDAARQEGADMTTWAVTDAVAHYVPMTVAECQKIQRLRDALRSAGPNTMTPELTDALAAIGAFGLYELSCVLADLLLRSGVSIQIHGCGGGGGRR